jgi:hypothetical protein
MKRITPDHSGDALFQELLEYQPVGGEQNFFTISIRIQEDPPGASTSRAEKQIYRVPVKRCCSSSILGTATRLSA